MCRVWYDNVPPGRQPAATSCREAERVASRDRNARVIYGSQANDRDNGWWSSRGNGYPDYGRNGGTGYPDYGRYPDRNRGVYGSDTMPFRNGFDDGYEKGREDARDRDRYDPTRHSRYKSGDHEYDKRYGTKDQYRVVYRDGFRAGYDEAYRSFAARR
jgi:hypothetical protein